MSNHKFWIIKLSNQPMSFNGVFGTYAKSRAYLV